MKRPEFTKEQENWLCEMIGNWYLIWKDRMCSKGGTHNLGVAKEQLKALVCNDMEFFEDIK